MKATNSSFQGNYLRESAIPAQVARFPR